LSAHALRVVLAWMVAAGTAWPPGPRSPARHRVEAL